MFTVEKNIPNKGWNMYIYKESFSPNADKAFALVCVIDRKSMNNEIAKKVELM